MKRCLILALLDLSELKAKTINTPRLLRTGNPQAILFSIVDSYKPAKTMFTCYELALSSNNILPLVSGGSPG